MLSGFASSRPDGLDAVARDGCTFDENDTITGGDCIARDAEANQTDDSPLADYGIDGIDNPYVSTGLAGVTGVLITFAVGGGLFWLARRTKREPVDTKTDGRGD